MYLFYKVKEEVKQSIPYFYATGAKEKFCALRQQKEKEWKSHSEEEQSRLREVLDDLEKEIKEQQEMAAIIRDDLEDVSKIEDSEMPVFDKDTQEKYDAIVQQQMEEKLRVKIQEEDKKRQWLLDVVTFHIVTHW